MKIYLLVSIILITLSCVGPPDPDHWLVNNYPGVVNTESLFKFELKEIIFHLKKTIL